MASPASVDDSNSSLSQCSDGALYMVCGLMAVGGQTQMRPGIDSCHANSIQTPWSSSPENHEAYAKFDPLHASQNSRTTVFVWRAPRRLSTEKCLESGLIKTANGLQA